MIDFSGSTCCGPKKTWRFSRFLSSFFLIFFVVGREVLMFLLFFVFGKFVFFWEKIARILKVEI